MNDGSQIHEHRPVAVPGHPLRRNPLFAHVFSRKEERDTKALTRVLTNQESAMSINSPQGLLLHGEVGTGKSFLVDLLADALPNSKKRRWHFNTFMLETLARLEQLRQSRSTSIGGGDNTEHSLIWLAKDMIEHSPVLFLDEFQLPDRAASKILSNLFTAFFQLGGVLVATSNRMPDELAKASGMDYFAGPGRGGVVKNWLGMGSNSKLDMFPTSNEYAGFVDVLKARCEIWNMEGGRDWRRREIEAVDAETAEIAETMREEMVGDLRSFDELRPIFDSAGYGSTEPADDTKLVTGVTPKKYVLAAVDSDEIWQLIVSSVLPPNTPSPIPWQSTVLQVYGRKVPIPCHLQGVTYWTFEDLCIGSFGPADCKLTNFESSFLQTIDSCRLPSYPQKWHILSHELDITLASTFHTLILDNVPVLTMLQKNEARRLITLLDALYEARCKLVLRAAAGPDELFFPETKTSSTDANDGGDAVYPETLSEIYQDQTAPFRPNISAYQDSDPVKAGYDPDEDSDFGPLGGRGRDGHGNERGVDFGQTSSFTGEDERFAYKRARSRLWEMCGARWHARDEEGWWRPLPLEFRRWEKSASGNGRVNPDIGDAVKVGSDVKLGDSIELDRPAGLQGKEMEERQKQMSSSAESAKKVGG